MSFLLGSRAPKGCIRVSPRSTAQPLNTTFPIIFSSCVSKVRIGFIPARAGERVRLLGPAVGRGRASLPTTALQRPSTPDAPQPGRDGGPLVGLPGAGGDLHARGARVIEPPPCAVA
jgi:hypothetical protein